MAQTLQRRAEAVEGLRIEVSEQQTMFKHYKQNAEVICHMMYSRKTVLITTLRVYL